MRNLIFLLSRFAQSFFLYGIFVALFVFFVSFFQFRGAFVEFDKLILNFFISLRHDLLTDIMRFVTFFGGVEFILLITFLLLLFFWLKKEWSFFAILLSSVGISSFVVFELKEIFSRERPSGVALIKESDFSFPSGHAMMAIAFWGFLAYFLAKRVRNRFWKNFSVAIIIILAFSISVSRVYLGVHWPTDILGSWILGGVWLAGLIWLFERLLKEAATSTPE